ncbi:hypothetical protein [Flavobacterium defluvii]|uniref:hypothetical protein n=1 Tax=Flavobacterium defluvii TaxID=370979 RepID=UPI001FCA3A47|nr:hypothetical protein [Flavobacterium defluvii]
MFFLCSNAQNLTPTSTISISGSADSFKGGYTFSYATAGTPWNGSLISYGGFYNNSYDTQISSDYGPNGGNHISFRTRNGDANIWNPWIELATKGNNTFVGNQVINGNVGIGKTNPTNKLDVNGTIHSREVKVDMDNWSDFVFKKEYQLPTIQEVEKYIKEKGHLENIPNEEEVLKEGINLGEMNAKLLQKIEELTLYVIEQNKQITDLQNRLVKIESTSN